VFLPMNYCLFNCSHLSFFELSHGKLLCPHSAEFERESGMRPAFVICLKSFFTRSTTYFDLTYFFYCLFFVLGQLSIKFSLQFLSSRVDFRTYQKSFRPHPWLIIAS